MVAPRQLVSDVIERVQQEFGPNQNLIRELMKKFKHDPMELQKVVDRLENSFDQLEAHGFNPRKIIPAFTCLIRKTC